MDDKDSKDDEAVVHSFTDEEDLEVFQPTSEWQELKPGQAIPAGLHVQVDIQTGKKQAKLMDGDNGERFRNHEKTKYLRRENQAKQKFVQIDKNIFSKQHLKDALKDFKDKFHDEKPENSEDAPEISEFFLHSFFFLFYAFFYIIMSFKCYKSSDWL